MFEVGDEVIWRSSKSSDMPYYATVVGHRINSLCELEYVLKFEQGYELPFTEKYLTPRHPDTYAWEI